VTGTPDAKAAAAAAERPEPIQKDSFSPGTAGPLDMTDQDPARAWMADRVNNAGAVRLAHSRTSRSARPRLPDR
jgi:hypothetical protein